jgi:hypothetical protein
MSLTDYAIYDICVAWSRKTSTDPQYAGQHIVYFDGPQITSEFGEVSKSKIYKTAVSLRKAGWLVLVKETALKGDRMCSRHYRVLSHEEWATQHPGACEHTRAAKYAGRAKVSPIKTASSLKTELSPLETPPSPLETPVSPLENQLSPPRERTCNTATGKQKTGHYNQSNPTRSAGAGSDGIGSVSYSEDLKTQDPDEDETATSSAPSWPIGMLLADQLGVPSYYTHGEEWDKREVDLLEADGDVVGLYKALWFFLTGEGREHWWGQKIKSPEIRNPMAFVCKSAASIVLEYQKHMAGRRQFATSKQTNH